MAWHGMASHAFRNGAHAQCSLLPSTRQVKCPIEGTKPLVDIRFEKVKAIAYPGGDRYKGYNECEQNEFAEVALNGAERVCHHSKAEVAHTRSDRSRWAEAPAPKAGVRWG